MRNNSDSGASSYLAYWPALLLVGFLPFILQPGPILGYRWTVEFAIAAFLLAALLFSIIRNRRLPLNPIPRKEFAFVVLPILLFTIWSGASAFWAFSTRGAIHHTLLWACFLIFYLLVRNVTASTQNLTHSFKVVGVVMAAIGFACVIEFIGSVKPITEAFTTRYYIYAEACVTLLPLFAVFAVVGKTKTAATALIVFAAGWAMVFLCMSRTMLAAGVVGMVSLVTLTALAHRRMIRPRRWAMVFGGLLLIALITQSSLFFNENSTTIERLSPQNTVKVESAKARGLLWGLAIEGFKISPIKGIGADNYFSRYRDLRELLSRDPVFERYSGINEAVIPERAHNEYLQILSELGIVGFLLFGWLLVGALVIVFASGRKFLSFQSIGALSGIAAFLTSSLTSSYSFRMPHNGICFFFLLAVAVGGHATKQTVENEEQKDRLRLDRLFCLTAAGVCVAMIAFSLLRGISVMHLGKSLATAETAVAESEIQKAIELDPDEALFRFYNGIRLLGINRPEEASPELRIAIDRGMATSIAYFSLYSAQRASRQDNEADATLRESLELYPHSIFLRTAYSAFLRQQGNAAAADHEYQIAESVDSKQAKSWQIAHEKGLAFLATESRRDNSYLDVNGLKPKDAPLALANFQALGSK